MCSQLWLCTIDICDRVVVTHATTNIMYHILTLRIKAQMIDVKLQEMFFHHFKNSKTRRLTVKDLNKASPIGIKKKENQAVTNTEISVWRKFKTKIIFRRSISIEIQSCYVHKN